MQCSSKALSWVLNNSKQPTIQQMVAAAQVLDVSVNDLIKLEDAPEA
ncbi:hypothetical protein [Hymenobacter metallilatus]|nr:hypothetical protein [Hymenobacter metallilatus]